MSTFWIIFFSGLAGMGIGVVGLFLFSIWATAGDYPPFPCPKGAYDDNPHSH